MYNTCTIFVRLQLYKYCTTIVHILYNDQCWSLPNTPQYQLFYAQTAQSFFCHHYPPIKQGIIETEPHFFQKKSKKTFPVANFLLNLQTYCDICKTN